VAIVNLNEDKLKQFAFVNNFKEELPDLLNLKDVEIGVLKQLERMANNHQLSEIEKIRRILIIDKPFTVQSGLMTSTHKLKRHSIKETYNKELLEIFNQESRNTKRYTTNE
jgi:long-subunit acyl-CoA synthetase (AMP-forming)